MVICEGTNDWYAVRAVMGGAEEVSSRRRDEPGARLERDSALIDANEEIEYRHGVP